MKVPFFDVSATYRELESDIDAAVKGVLRDGHYILGDEGKQFESEFAAFCGASYCIGSSNGLDALQVTLRAWGVGAGDEVIVPAHTFVATWLAVSFTGATPVPVDVELDTSLIDPNSIQTSISERTKAIIPVHLYGQPADMDEINSLASSGGIKVLEDAAQAHGATYKGRPAGSLAHAAAFSFYPAKNLGAFGDAGAVTTNDQQLEREIRKIANYGSAKKYEHEVTGLNCRLDELQAALLRVKLRKLKEWNKKREEIVALYNAELSGLSGVTPPTCERGASVSQLRVRHPN